MYDKNNENKLWEIFKQKYDKNDPKSFHAPGGIFGEIIRKRLLEMKGKKNYTFWYKVRKSVKTALLDLQLFIETSEAKDVDQVLTRRTLKPILKALFEYSIVDQSKPESSRAIVAQLFIEEAFQYLKFKNMPDITDNQNRIIHDALELSEQLTVLLLPEAERGRFRNRAILERSEDWFGESGT